MGNVKINVLGFPRIGSKRELKFAVEKYWSKAISQEELEQVGADIRQKNWELQKKIGVTFIPSNDFSYYDQVLDTSVLLGNIPERFKKFEGTYDLPFVMARGDEQNETCFSCEMTKWFDTNYHYIVPEFSSKTNFKISSTKIFDEYSEAKNLGIETKPVLIGPFSYLKLGKEWENNFNRWLLVPALVKTYKEILARLKYLGVEWIQLDEAYLGLDLQDTEKSIFSKIYREILSEKDRPKIILTTYFSPLRENAKLLTALPFEALHLDCVRAAEDALELKDVISSETILSLGLVNGRNVWAANYTQQLNFLENFKKLVQEERIWIGTSCSLLHVPISTIQESVSVREVTLWLSFAEEKLRELKFLADHLNGKKRIVEFDYNVLLHENKKKSPLTTRLNVQHRLANIDFENLSRDVGFDQRYELQQKKLNLPLFPTTTIGSFPQTKEIRKIRNEFKNKEISQEAYDNELKELLKDVIEHQEKIGLDVLVHGEFERTDMVEYFADHLIGFATTKNGWVQSYGSRCIKPPVIYGDIERANEISVSWSKYAQSLTQKSVKGMLTGPVTILQWSFPREDYSAERSAYQIALAISDEVKDLEEAGLGIIQVDEPAFREGTPLRKGLWADYFDWAVKAFRLSTYVVKPETQIHTHMCYSDFNDILEPIKNLDADVITIETSRSHDELLKGLETYSYPNGIGPGVYDVHSPAIPSVQSIKELLLSAQKVIPKGLLWVNPDCGLKTRNWKEVTPALENMVEACKQLRENKI